MGILDYLFIIMASIIWLSLSYNLILMYFGYRYYLDMKKIETDYHLKLFDFPFVSIMIPAHNESKVILETLKAIDRLDYPKDR